MCVCMCLWTVPRNHLGGVACGVGSLTERGRVDCVQSSREQLVFVMVRCFYHHLVDNALLMCLFYGHFWVDFHGIGTCFDVVNVQPGCFLLCCLLERPSRRREHCGGQVLKLERPVLPWCCCGVKAR